MYHLNLGGVSEMESGVSIRDLQSGTIEAKFEKFFRSYYHKEILRVIHGYPETKSLVVDFNDLDKYDITLADELINNPDATLAAAENALHNIERPPDVPTARINVRFANLPASHRIMIRDLRSEDVGKFLAMEGLVRKVTDVRPKLVMGVYECPYCGHETSIPQDGDKLREPFICEGCEKKAQFNLLIPKSTFIDAQKILVQEDLEDLRGGEHPKQISIFLEDDLTGMIMPGDRIEIAGVLRATKKIIKGTRSRVFEIFIEANSFTPKEMDFEEVEITKEDEKEIKKLAGDPSAYDKIRDSIAPHIYGYKEIKEAIMYQLFSAPMMQLPDGGRIRGDSHIILIGEPATGKSELLQYVARELAPRGIYASGKGTSTAGLTATAVRDDFGDGSWTLEAGALVLADLGVACVDEFDKMEETDRAAMHETLEQQQVSIAKAGMLATFRARCAVLAAANPKYGRFDKYRAISEQVNLTPTILSRFDLIFFVEDELEDTKQVAKHIMDTAVTPQAITSPVPAVFLRRYIAYARQNCSPNLSPDARERIESFYVEMREAATKKEDMPIPMTARQLWAIIRLAKASARVRLSDTATVEDVERAINLVNFSLKQAGMDIEAGKVDIDKIMVGVTKSQRDRINEIIRIIRGLEREFETARKSEIVQRCGEKGISERDVEELLEKLKRDGNIYEPKHGNYKVV